MSVLHAGEMSTLDNETLAAGGIFCVTRYALSDVREDVTI